MLGKLCNLLVISVTLFTCCLAVDVTDFKRSFSLDCDSHYNPLCLKMDIAAFVERLSSSAELILSPSVSIVKDNNANATRNAEIIAELSRSFPNDPSKRMDGFLFSKLSEYLQSHTLRFRLWDSKSSIEDARDAFTGRKGKIGGGKKGGLEGLIAAAMMMKGTMMALALGALAALAGKALMTGMMALMLSAIVGLKALASGGGKQTTYEIVAKPYYSHSHSSSHEDHHGGHGGGGGGGGSHTGYGGYGRSLNLVLPEHLKKP